MTTKALASAVAALGLASAALLAQGPPGGRGGPKAGQTVEKIRPLKPDLYMITGGGANTLIRVTPEGLILVDTKNPGEENYNRVMEEIRSVSNLSVKYVFNTHHHPDHVGNNQKFIDAGATVVALEALKADMASDQRATGDHGIAPDRAVVGDMTRGHDVVIVPDHRHRLRLRAARDRVMLPDFIARSDSEIAAVALEILVQRIGAEVPTREDQQPAVHRVDLEQPHFAADAPEFGDPDDLDVGALQ